MIKSVMTKNMKGRSRVQPLTGKDIIIGHNGTGKSTIIQAISLAILGYIPGQDKTLAETFKYSSGKEMSVGLETEKFSFARQLVQNDGAIKEEIALTPSKGEKTTTQKENRIKEEIGNFPPMLLDFGDFLKMTDTKRRELIYKLMGVDETAYTKDNVKEYLYKVLLTEKLKESEPEKYNVMQEVIEDTLKQYPEEFTIQEGITSMVDWVNNKLTFWKKEVDENSAAVKRAAQVKNELSVTEKNLVDNKAEYESLSVKLIELEKQIAGDTEKKKAIEKRLNRIAELQNEINKLSNQEQSSATAIKAQIEVLKAQIKQDDCSEEIKKLEDNIKPLAEELNKLKNDIEVILQNGIKVKTEIKTYQELLEKVNQQDGRCVIDAKISCNKDFSKYKEYLNMKISELEGDRINLIGQYKKLQIDIEQKEKEVNKLTAQKENLVKSERDAIQANNEVNNKINTLKAKINEIEGAEKLRLDKINIRQAELDKLMSEKTETIAPIDVIEKQRDAVKNRLKELKACLDEQDKVKNSQIEIKNLTLQAHKAQRYVEVYNQLSKKLGPKGLQGELLKVLLSPMTYSITNNLAMMRIDKEFYFQCLSSTGKEIFQFGWKNEKGEMVNYDALSKGEKALLLTALSLSVIEKADPKLKILVIDDFQDIDEQNMKKVLTGLSKVSGNLDNIILSGFIMPEAINSITKVAEEAGFKVWNLDIKEEQEQIGLNGNIKGEEQEEAI